MTRTIDRILFPTLFAAALGAQSASAPSAPLDLPRDRVTPLHTLPGDEGVEYGLWAAGAGYKVCFDDGVRVVPYLGRQHATAESLRWHTTSVRIGARQLLTGATPARTHGDRRVEFDHGAVVEAYDVLVEGLEQTFVLLQPVAAEGELVIRGAIDGTLQAGLHGSAVQFATADGRPCVEYGAATAIDANGRCRAMVTTLVDGGIELQLDGAWLATASYPVVVDPLIAPVDLFGGTEVADVAIVRDQQGTNPVYVAEVRYASLFDADLWLYRTNDGGTIKIDAFADLTTSWSSTEPSLGIDLTTGRSLCSWTRHIVGSDTRRVRLHRHLRTDLGLDPSIIYLDSPDGRNRWRPEVGSDFGSSSLGSLLVVCQVESTGAWAEVTTSQIRAAVVDVTGAGAIANEFVIADVPLTDTARPTVANVAATAGSRQWTVAWQNRLNFAFPPNTTDWQVKIARVDDFGVIGTPFTLPPVAGQHRMAPRIAGLNDRLMVFCTESSASDVGSNPAAANGHRIRGARLDYAPGGYSLPHGVKLLQSNADPRLVIAGAAYDHVTQNHWGMSFESTVTQRLYLRTYGFTGSQISDELVDQPGVANGLCVPGGIAGRGLAGGFVLAWGMNDWTGGNHSRYTRYFWNGLSRVATGPSSCNGTDIDWYGFSLVGTQDCGVRVSSMPANSFAAVFVATSAASLQLFGLDGVHDGCWLLVPIVGPDAMALMGPALGPVAEFPLPLPEFVAPQTLYFQGAVFDPAFGEFFSTQRLEVQIGY